MKSVIYGLIIASYSIPQLFRVLRLADNAEKQMAYIAVASLLIFLIASYFTWRKKAFFRFVTSGYLAISGLFMLPWIMSPAIESFFLRILLSLAGLFWIASAIWILKCYSTK